MGDSMAGNKKKMAAALAAVTLYLQEEAAAQERQALPQGPQGLEFSQWGQSGRQEMMAMRRLVQLRVFTRF